jgi:hypothetical protein
MTCNQRIQSGKVWINDYQGKNPVQGYSKKYGVDLLCAIKELRIIGIEISEKYESDVKMALNSQHNIKNHYKIIVPRIAKNRTESVAKDRENDRIILHPHFKKF